VSGRDGAVDLELLRRRLAARLIHFRPSITIGSSARPMHANHWRPDIGAVSRPS
jgi:hypothetical protein